METFIRALFYKNVYWPHAALLVGAILPIYLVRNVDTYLAPLLGTLWIGSVVLLLALLVLLTSFQHFLTSSIAFILEAVVRKVDRLSVLLIMGLGAFALLKKSIGYEMLYPEDVIMLSGWLTAGFFAFFKVREMLDEQQRKMAWFVYAMFMAAPYTITMFAWFVYPYTY